MRKKWNVIAAVLCISLLAGACASQNSKKEETVTNESTEKTTVMDYQSKLDMIQPQAYSNVEGLSLEPGTYISIIGKSAGGEYWDAVKKGVDQAAADINATLNYEGKDKVKVTYSGPTSSNDVDEQVNILDEELARYPVALGISIVDAKACEVQFDLAAEGDIPVVAFDSGSDYQGLMSTVATDNQASAREAADRLAEEMGHGGEIAIFVQDSKSKVAMERESAFTEQIQNQHTGIQIVNVYNRDKLAQMQQQIADEINAGSYNKETKTASGQPLPEDQKVTADSISEAEVVDYIFAKNPNITGCYGTNGETAMLAVGGIDRLKKGTDIAVVAFDADEEEVKALTAGKINGLIVQNPFGMGYAAVVAAARASLEIGNEAVVNTGYTWVTKKNMKNDEIKKMLY